LTLGHAGVPLVSDSLQKFIEPNNKDAAEQSFLIGQESPFQLEGRYEILEEIGKGGMGVVYKARQPALQKLYAIKVLHSVHVKEITLRFEREARAISKLDHPNLITSHDFGVTDAGIPYMVMDFIQGQSLAQLIKEQGSLSLAETLNISSQIARGMAHAHGLGVCIETLNRAISCWLRNQTENCLSKLSILVSPRL
jgi:serine/threonine protein kinase